MRSAWTSASLWVMATVLHELATGASFAAAQASTPPAEPVVTSLAWTRGGDAGECIDTTELRAAVEQRLGRAAFRDTAPLQIRGHVERAGDGFRVEIALVLNEEVVGRRTLRSDRRRCRAVDDSVAVMIALLVEVGEEAVELSLPAPPVERPSPTPAPSSPGGVPVGPAPAATREPSAAAGFAMGVGALANVDALPGLALAPLVALELVLAPLSLRLEGAYAPDVSVDLGRGRAARLALAWAGLSGCLDASATPWLGLGGCVGLRGGAVRGVGLGFDVGRSGTLPWLALAGSGRARVAVAGPVGVELAIGLDVPLLRDRFVVQGADGATRRVYAPPSAAPFAQLSLVGVLGSASGAARTDR